MFAPDVEKNLTRTYPEDENITGWTYDTDPRIMRLPPGYEFQEEIDNFGRKLYRAVEIKTKHARIKPDPIP